MARRALNSVLVSTHPEQLPRLRFGLRSVGLAEARSRSGLDDWPIVEIDCPTDEQALRLTATLRRLGWASAWRPPDDGREVAWHRTNAPIDISGRLSICRPWSTEPRHQPVVIDPGSVFGIGDHPSTRLVLETLCDRIEGGERVLDVGTGSGVLAIAALLLGAASARGIDMDPASPPAALDNAARNRVDVTADATPLGDVDGTFDLVLANILRPALEQLAPDLVRRAGSDGSLVVSGISPGQRSAVAAAFTPLVVASERVEPEWVALLFRAAGEAHV